MKLKGFKKSDGSIAKIYTDPTLTESDSPADAASVKAKDDLLQQGITNNANYAAGLNTRLSELENGAPSIIAPKVTEWLEDNVNPVGSAVTVDSSLTVAGSAADAKKTGDEIGDLKSDLTESIGDLKSALTGFENGKILFFYDIIPNSYPNAQGGFSPYDGWNRSDYIPVNGGETIYFENTYFSQDNAWYDSDKNIIDRFAIAKGNPATVVSPDNAAFMVISNNAEQFFGDVFLSQTTFARAESIVELKSEINSARSDIGKLGYASNTFSYTNGTTHSSLSNVAYLPITANEKFKITIQTPVASNILITPFAQKADGTSDQLAYISFSGGSGEKEYTASVDYVGIGLYIGNSFESREVSFAVETENSVLKVGALATPPEITFTSGFNVNYSNGELVADENYKYAKIDVRLFQGGNISGTTAVFPNGDAGLAFKDVNDDYIIGYRNTTSGVYKWQYDVPIPQSAAYLYLPLRIASESDYVAPNFPWDVVVQNVQKMQGDIDKAVTEAKEINHTLDNARHIKGNTIAPLTLLHFSDLHYDRKALSRIMKDAENSGTLIDEKICTGDMVANTYEEISSWWDSSVLTCIGNHDTASYNSSTGYNWTALSMADRDAYYIAPFESGWGIVHTSGTSYYYKDYTTQKIRLIVMDAMLYTGTPGAEATAQTAWLANLLSDAITNNLHVLIAIHSPHGGATAKDCSFSRYGQGTMPTWTDCNTPQTVIDTVASAITNGLHFIGYIVGHTHQDNIWDADGDGKQLMYCVTCAAVNNQDQWKNSDQYRGTDADAYNLVTIDTTNTLVKLVRGGGADIDDHMRTRKAICFNYSTGQKVGEVL